MVQLSRKLLVHIATQTYIAVVLGTVTLMCSVSLLDVGLG